MRNSINKSRKERSKSSKRKNANYGFIEVDFRLASKLNIQHARKIDIRVCIKIGHL